MMHLQHSLAFLCLLATLICEVAAGAEVLATVYYEAKCPDSRDFVVQQLLPAVLRDPQLIRPVLVPFGFANVNTTADGYDFTCQHGESECLGNRLHACALALTDSRTLQVSFAACLMSNYTDVAATAKACADELGLPSAIISECANGPAGSELLRAYGNATKALNPQPTWIPTVTLNGSRGNQTAILSNFWEEVVKLSETLGGASRMSRNGSADQSVSLLLLLSCSLVAWLKP